MTITKRLTSVPSRMRAVEISEGALRACERATPCAGRGQVLVRVVSAGVNRPDVLQRKGLYPAPPGITDIPGLEVSGEVVGLGDGVVGDGFPRVGDSVCGLVSGGGYAEYCVIDSSLAMPFPSGFSFVESAALPETFLTVWNNVFVRGGLREGESFLVHGGSSGIGSAAIPLARSFGCRVFATVGEERKRSACLSWGADRVVLYPEEDFVSAFSEATDGRGVDVILDMVGGEYVSRNVSLAAEDGRIVLIAFLGGPTSTANLMPLMLKRLTLTGSTLRSRPVSEKAELASAVRRNVYPLFESGRIRPVIHARVPLSEAAEAHRMMEAGEHIGKIMLDVE